jgi:Xaa-Pro aminopeptidase
MNIYQERISELKSLLVKYKIDAYIIPSTDEHQNEYTPEFARRRQWMSGFTGSAGDLIVTRTNAYLWTDSRYYLQAALELAGTEVELLKAGELAYSDVYDWIANTLNPLDSFGADPDLITYEDALSIKNRFQVKKIRLKFIERNLVDLLWKDKAPRAVTPAEIHSVKYCGEDYRIKIKRLREKMSETGCAIHIIASLDSICWLLNIRGNDIPYNPVLISYLIVTDQKVMLFTDKNKISKALFDHFENEVEVTEYGEFEIMIKKIPSHRQKIWIDPKRTSYKITNIIGKKSEIYKNESPVYYYKALKNTHEILSLREVMVKDGIAMVRFLFWLEKNVGSGSVTEKSASEKLEEYRGLDRDYRGPSFHTISAFGGHGAITHYSHTEESSIPVTIPGIYMIDSGAHYPGGTTDITRSIAIGTPTQEQRDRYTRVLKGHIQLALAIFPKGTKGIQLDILARKSLWDKGLDYGHGTGHGVGFYLNVHEGPHSISPSRPATPGLEPGMIVTDEPGYYKQGEYGIRIENILLVDIHDKFDHSTSRFHRFRTLTLCPYDRNLIDTELLSETETAFVDAYHQRVNDLLSVGLSDAGEKDWLAKMTAPIGIVKNNTADLSDFF